AIELAAARAGALGVAAIAARLGNALQLLDGVSTPGARPQRTLRATLDWSYALLPPEEQRLFRRLAIFAGGCTVEAAEAVGAGDGIAAEDILPLLAQLVDRSLVLVDESAGPPRYRLLEIVRQYAWERLVTGGEAAGIARRHTTYYARLVE